MSDIWRYVVVCVGLTQKGARGLQQLAGVARIRIDNIVRELKARGVQFEHYDFPGMKREGDVHVAGKIRNAWFKDPDGNILSVVNG